MKFLSLLSTVIVSTLALSLHAAPELKTFTDFAKAKAAAEATKKPILVEFTGSQWCPPCKIMKRDTLSKEAFINYANENLVFMRVDFPSPDFQDPSVPASGRMLQERLNINAVPTYVLMQPDGTVITMHEGGMPGGPDAFVAWIKKSL